jgi:hypothetical protein
MLNAIGSLAYTLVALWASLTAAPIYKYVDDQGNVTYSNSPHPGAKIIVLDPAPPPGGGAAARENEASRPSREKQAKPDNFPRVDSDTQKKREAGRRAILEEELRNEEKALAEAKKALEDGEQVRLGGERNYQKYLDRIQGLKDTVETHEKNLQAIRQELGANN